VDRRWAVGHTPGRLLLAHEIDRSAYLVRNRHSPLPVPHWAVGVSQATRPVDPPSSMLSGTSRHPMTAFRWVRRLPCYIILTLPLHPFLQSAQFVTVVTQVRQRPARGPRRSKTTDQSI